VAGIYSSFKKRSPLKTIGAKLRLADTGKGKTEESPGLKNSREILVES
jgi:hypothetical protein